MRHVRLIRTIVLSLCMGSLSFAKDKKATCATCHADQTGQIATSIHHALSCRDCHGGEASYALAPADAAKYANRSVGGALTFEHGSSFLGKPSRKEVPQRCGGCHADVERMNPYGLPTDQLSRYWTSGHGKALKTRSDERVAVCVDCHGSHDVLPGKEPRSKTHALNVPDTCITCHGDAELAADYDWAVEIVDEYRQSVHGKLLLEQQDSGAPTCATCHGNHAALPPGFATVGAVCGQCHEHVAKHFASSIHASLEMHKGCVQCHGGGEGRYFHLIERITKPPGVLIQRYAHLLSREARPTSDRITEHIHPDPRQIVTRALPTCTECHDDLEDDESLPKLFELLDDIAGAERHYVKTAARLDEVGRGVLIVDNQRFLLEDAKTLLIGLAPLQHTLDNDRVAEEVAKLSAVCDQVDDELTQLEDGLRRRHRALLPIWGFAVVFAIALYVKYRRLETTFVKPLPPEAAEQSR